MLRNRGSLAPDDGCTTKVPIVIGTPIDGALATTDCLLTASNTYIDYYDFQGTAGQAISISQVSTTFDTYLVVFDTDGNVLEENDDSGGTSNSRIPVDSGVVTLGQLGRERRRVALVAVQAVAREAPPQVENVTSALVTHKRIKNDDLGGHAPNRTATTSSGASDRWPRPAGTPARAEQTPP